MKTLGRINHSISIMSRVLKFSRSGYYAWLKGDKSLREKENDLLSERIRALHLESKGIYGAPRIHALLRREGRLVSKKRVARLMRDAGIMGVTGRKKWKTTKRAENRRPAPDLVDRDFTAEGPDQLWVAEITHIPTRSQPVYLATVLDVWSRKVVGWSMSTQMPAELVISALEMAVSRRNPQGEVIHHSDQGSQYTSEKFMNRCKELGVLVSMGSVGDCYDNAMAESFFATLESELLNIVPLFVNPEEAKREIFMFIEGFYNEKRLHGQLVHRSPSAFEAAHAVQLAA